MPKLAMAMNEGTVAQWMAAEGDFLRPGDVVMAVETEKVTYEVEAPHEGYLHILVPEGETVPVETPVGKFAENEDELKSLQQEVQSQDADKPVEAAPSAVPGVAAPTGTDLRTASSTASGGRIKASPLARKIARDKGLDIALLQGTGPGGRIVKRDILLALEQGIGRFAAATAVGGMREKARLPLSGARATVASRMMESLQSSAQLASRWESDITDLLRMRTHFVAREEQFRTSVSMNAFIIRAIVSAIRQVPIINAALQGEDIVIYENVNMGLAISLPGESPWDSSLMVPVIRDVDSMGVVEIDREMKALVERARNGQLGPDDMKDSTITLSSTAGLAPPGMSTSPVLNLPNAVIVGPSTPQEKPVSRNGEIVVRTMMPMSMTFDHRILNGEPAARFMKYLHECLEHPELMLA
ncbi:MAG: 2-oxo acid dehydrogenase subunit E2 [Gammaproteobacteria bacterium]|nr:2-oxo acid dehydrogenase subunit E2 [Gammaproteobacteria bacterium]